MERPRRPIIRQDFSSFALTVQLTPTPLSQASQQASIQAMYDAFIISVPSTAGGSVFLGGANVNFTAKNGLEIMPGVPIMLSINNERQLYEVQAPLVDMNCTVPEVIPYTAWDLTTVYLVAAAAPRTIGVILFKGAFL